MNALQSYSDENNSKMRIEIFKGSLKYIILLKIQDCSILSSWFIDNVTSNLFIVATTICSYCVLFHESLCQLLKIDALIDFYRMILHIFKDRNIFVLESRLKCFSAVRFASKYVAISCFYSVKFMPMTSLKTHAKKWIINHIS